MEGGKCVGKVWIFIKNLNFEGKSDTAGNLLFKFKIKGLLSFLALLFLPGGWGAFHQFFREGISPPPILQEDVGGGYVPSPPP